MGFIKVPCLFQELDDQGDKWAAPSGKGLQYRVSLAFMVELHNQGVFDFAAQIFLSVLTWTEQFTRWRNAEMTVMGKEQLDEPFCGKKIRTALPSDGSFEAAFKKRFAGHAGSKSWIPEMGTADVALKITGLLIIVS